MKYQFGKNSPNIQAKIKSKQFELSEKLLDLRFKKHLSFDDMCAILDLTPQYYIDLEYGETHIPISEYEKAIAKVESYKG